MKVNCLSFPFVNIEPICVQLFLFVDIAFQVDLDGRTMNGMVATFIHRLNQEKGQATCQLASEPIIQKDWVVLLPAIHRTWSNAEDHSRRDTWCSMKCCVKNVILFKWVRVSLVITTLLVFYVNVPISTSIILMSQLNVAGYGKWWTIGIYEHHPHWSLVWVQLERWWSTGVSVCWTCVYICSLAGVVPLWTLQGVQNA